MKIASVDIARQARAAAPKPLDGVPGPAAALRKRIGLVEAVLAAGAAVEGSDPAFRRWCSERLPAVQEMRQAWVSAFGYDWDTGRRLRAYECPRVALVPLLQRGYIEIGQLDHHKPWRDAATVADRVLKVADEAIKPRPSAAFQARLKAVADEQARAQRMQERQEAWAQRELEEFRAGKQPRFRFPVRGRVRERTFG